MYKIGVIYEGCCCRRVVIRWGVRVSTSIIAPYQFARHHHNEKATAAFVFLTCRA